ncbi:MAG TPA: NADH-quinone oxidoreductase subunit K [Microthrixaceae bacterium]|nr:NADH-quinone oxidoreductase subunit K [Microthrixaceae bacterium]
MTGLMVIAAGVLCACGTYLVLSRQLSRVVIGLGLLGHGVNVLLVLSGGDGGDPAFAGGDAERFADPLPQAFVLTAIVITFGVVAFLLSLAYLSWRITGDDNVEDDIEDRRIARESQEAAEPVEPGVDS